MRRTVGAARRSHSASQPNATDAKGLMRALGVASIRSVGRDGRDSVADAFSPAAHTRLQRVNVRGDGHCGAYVLALVHFAMTHQALSRAQVRQQVYRLATQIVINETSMSSTQRHDFIDGFRLVARRAFLNDSEMVLFLHSHLLSVCILIRDSRSSFRVQHYRCGGAVGWVFLIFSRGCHWELLARTGSRPNTFEPVWLLTPGYALARHVARRARVSEGMQPSEAYTTILDGVPLFEMDFQDRIWT